MSRQKSTKVLTLPKIIQITFSRNKLTCLKDRQSVLFARTSEPKLKASKKKRSPSEKMNGGGSSRHDQQSGKLKENLLSVYSVN